LAIQAAPIELYSPKLLNLLERAHLAYTGAGTLSIKSDLVAHDEENDVILFTSEITTPKGTFNGIGISDITDELPLSRAIEAARENALIEALMLAGMTSSPKITQPTITITSSTGSTSFGNTVYDVGTMESTPTAGNCSVCGKGIEGYHASSVYIPANKVAEKTAKRFGEPRCSDCSSKGAADKFNA
jgi:hypothetical protein